MGAKLRLFIESLIYAAKEVSKAAKWGTFWNSKHFPREQTQSAASLRELGHEQGVTYQAGQESNCHVTPQVYWRKYLTSPTTPGKYAAACNQDVLILCSVAIFMEKVSNESKLTGQHCGEYPVHPISICTLSLWFVDIREHIDIIILDKQQEMDLGEIWCTCPVLRLWKLFRHVPECCAHIRKKAHEALFPSWTRNWSAWLYT